MDGPDASSNRDHATRSAGLRSIVPDYVFPAGHRIGVIIVGSYRDHGSRSDQNRATITISPRSLVELPIVGGHRAALRAGLR